jgi:acetolactate synthase-1/2/3 large subunit
MKSTGGEIVVRALEDEGIRFAFGIPGTHNIELYDALAASEIVRPILVTDEQSASFMADGAWRASGSLACVNVVPGAGLTHALSGIAEAFLDNVPMLVLGCGIRGDLDRAFQLHDVDQRAIVSPVVKGTFHPERGDELYSVIRQACALARSGAPGPVFVEVPANLYLFKHDAGTSDGAWAPGSPEAPMDAAAVHRAASLLAGARRPLIYAGAGAAGGRDQLLGIAEILEAPVCTTFQGKGVFPESHPLFLWPGFGEAAPPFVREVARSCDVTLAVGCRFSEVATASYGLVPPGALIHVDIDSQVPGRNYPAELGIEADAKAFLSELLRLLSVKASTRDPDNALRAAIRGGHEKTWKNWLDAVGGARVTPAHLLRLLQTHLGSDAIYTTDSGNGTFLAMECLRLEQPGKFLAPVDYSCMGYAVPSALGAKLARPDCPVVALAGDGAFLMTGLEMLTGVREGLGVIVMVLGDGELAQIAQFQDLALSRKVSSEVPPLRFAELAKAVGVPYLRMESDGQVESVLLEAREAAAGGSPVLVEVEIDYAHKTYFTRGAVKTNLLRLPMKDRVRFVGRALGRRILG